MVSFSTFYKFLTICLTSLHLYVLRLVFNNNIFLLFSIMFCKSGLFISWLWCQSVGVSLSEIFAGGGNVGNFWKRWHCSVLTQIYRAGHATIFGVATPSRYWDLNIFRIFSGPWGSNMCCVYWKMIKMWIFGFTLIYTYYWVHIQNVPRDKTSQEAKRPRRQNVPRGKTS